MAIAGIAHSVTDMNAVFSGGKLICRLTCKSLTTIINLTEYMRFQCPVSSMLFGQLYGGKRESGASPERSGHCKRGERLQYAIVL